MSGLLEVLTMSDLFEFLTMIDIFYFLIYTEEVWVQLWIVLKNIRELTKV